MTRPFPNCARFALAVSLFALPAALHAQERTAPNAESSASAGIEPSIFTLVAAGGSASAGGREDGGEGERASEGGASQPAPAQAAAPIAQAAGAAPQMPGIVFDENWATIGIGAGMVPSYSGSDDYVAFPLPLIVGRVGGVGIRPNGPGIRLDFISPAPALGPGQKTTFNFGPAVRFRNDRAVRIKDDVVELAGKLDEALEIGAAGGVTFPGVFNAFDSLTLATQVRWDVLGAHEGMLVEPSLGYQRPFGTGVLFQASFGAQFVDDSFSDYYYSVSPTQSAASGLPEFTAEGGLNSLSGTAIVSFDLDGNALNGGLSIYTVTGYTRLVNDAADTPYTDLRGDANQFIAGAGIAYTF